MRKITIIFFTLIVSLTLLGNSKPFYDGILLKYFSSNSAIKKSLQIDNADILNEIIVLPNEPFDINEAAAIINRVDKLPHSLLMKIHGQHIIIKLFTGKLTDNPTADHLRGLIPRGYTSEKKWDDVPGIGGGRTVLVKIGHSEEGMGHGSINLELHELAHSIDQKVYQQLRYNPNFIEIWKQESSRLFPDSIYEQTFQEEYFAESFAMFYLNDESNRELKDKAPKTYEFIKHLK
ncbi:anthrax toxin lethal factor-related metalloendopeptidase [Bacillus dakarensis]|uniref:anthrax toxin lethal factor-related metalloendopeptidase n=1 Tax=Robertmurraya dakarensis TaxID=1926278 RepID=UPI000980F3B0|nr:toxin [Bacillus dakarensis]